MSNPHRGDVPLKAGGQSYTLRFSINSLCTLEDHFGEPMAAIAKRLQGAKEQGIRISEARAILWCGLLHHHPEIDIQAAGTVLDEAGLADSIVAIGRAFSLAFPSAKTSARPQKAAKT